VPPNPTASFRRENIRYAAAAEIGRQEAKMRPSRYPALFATVAVQTKPEESSGPIARRILCKLAGCFSGGWVSAVSNPNVA
jgi:hypothetical protein